MKNNKMKLVYAVDELSYNGKDHIGVVKKVESQMAQFEREGIETKLCQYSWHGGYPQIKIEKDTDILYFRRIDSSVKLIIKLQQLRKTSPKLRIIMEIPTYPFAAEEREKISFKRKINHLLGLKILRFYINRIVLIGQQYPIKELYHIKTICINNGVDFRNIGIRNVNDADDRERELHMICVSGCFFWHGYDRIIEGMHQYYAEDVKQDKVYLHIVGNGECLEEYKELAKKYELLDKKVFCHGRKTGKELDEIYDKCDIAIESLGAHRKKIYYSSSLKSREYAAKGLPMITSVQLDFYQADTMQYIKMFPGNDEPIEIKEIINFYDMVYRNRKKQNVAAEIRKAFYPYCDWKFVIKPVIEYMRKA